MAKLWEMPRGAQAGCRFELDGVLEEAAGAPTLVPASYGCDIRFVVQCNAMRYDCVARDKLAKQVAAMPAGTILSLHGEVDSYQWTVASGQTRQSLQLIAKRIDIQGTAQPRGDA